MSPSGCLERKGADEGVFLASSRIFLILFKGSTSRAPEIVQLPWATLPPPTSQWCNLITGVAIHHLLFYSSMTVKKFFTQGGKDQAGVFLGFYRLTLGLVLRIDVLLGIGGINSSPHPFITSTLTHWAIFPSPNTDLLRLWLPVYQFNILSSAQMPRTEWNKILNASVARTTTMILATYSFQKYLQRYFHTLVRTPHFTIFVSLTSTGHAVKWLLTFSFKEKVS